LIIGKYSSKNICFSKNLSGLCCNGEIAIFNFWIGNIYRIISHFIIVDRTVFADDQNNLLTDGQVFLFEIVDDGPYRELDSAVINSSDGTYSLEEIILGDYILKVEPGTTFPDVLQTYYVSVQDWLEADTLRLRERSEGIDIQMIFNPGNVIDEEFDALARGFVDEEFDETVEGGRLEDIEARRRVKKAGCSLRRRVGSGGGGRTDQDPNLNPADFTELIAYVETNDNGEFEFTNLPPNTYLLNIQYPGVPMDESSNIFLEVPEDREGTEFSISALVTEDGISVQIDEVLGTLKPFIKDAVLYPNPTNGILKLDYLVYRKMENLKASIITMDGKLMLEQELPFTLGQKTVEIDMRNLNGGVYLLKLENNSDEFTFSVPIIKE
jgi:hypothetical protein